MTGFPRNIDYQRMCLSFRMASVALVTELYESLRPLCPLWFFLAACRHFLNETTARDRSIELLQSRSDCSDIFTMPFACFSADCPLNMSSGF